MAKFTFTHTRFKKKTTATKLPHKKKALSKKPYNPYPLVVSAIRRIWMLSPNRTEALTRAKAVQPYIKADGTEGKRLLFLGYRCEVCGEVFVKVEVHHINPVGNMIGMVMVDALASMFCNADKLMVLCKECHLAIHKKERKKVKVFSSSDK